MTATLTDCVEVLRLTHRPMSPADTLLYYDGPVLFWLPEVNAVASGRRLLAMALPAVPGARDPFLVAELEPEAAGRFERREQDLRQTVLAAQAWYLLPDYRAPELVIQCVEGPLPERWLPGKVRL
jgi:hypothetical protein